MSLKIEIEEPCNDGEKYLVFVDDDEETFCDTLAEAYLYAAKRFHELGMLELQERINKL